MLFFWFLCCIIFSHHAILYYVLFYVFFFSPCYIVLCSILLFDNRLFWAILHDVFFIVIFSFSFGVNMILILIDLIWNDNMFYTNIFLHAHTPTVDRWFWYWPKRYLHISTSTTFDIEYVSWHGCYFLFVWKVQQQLKRLPAYAAACSSCFAHA